MGRDCSHTAEPILESSRCQELPDLSPQGQHRSKPLSDLCLSLQALLSALWLTNLLSSKAAPSF